MKLTFNDVKNRMGMQTTSLGNTYVLLDVSVEEFRVYYFPDGSRICIKNPIAVALIGERKSHRVINEQGETFYPKSSWNMLSWKVKEECKFFIA